MVIDHKIEGAGKVSHFLSVAAQSFSYLDIVCCLKMTRRCVNVCVLATIMYTVSYSHSATSYSSAKSFECGPYGFVCEGKGKLRLCEGNMLRGPAFLCPPNTICNEDSSDVCENTINYIDPAITKTVTCRRNERIADPSVPGCKGYILCIPNRNRFQGIKFKCSGTTIFNGYTRTCSSPDKYKCPLTNRTKAPSQYLLGDNRRIHQEGLVYQNTVHRPRPIDCKNYKFRVTEEGSPVKATYFCPSRPVTNGEPIRCTVFSNQYCLTLERDDGDQFMEHSGAAFRKPRKNNDNS